MRWQYRDPALAWLFVPAYLAHLAEEYFGGFPEWFGLIAGSPLPRATFLLINAVALMVLIAATRAATRIASRGWLIIAVAALALVNAGGHGLGSIATGAYSPGLITGVVLYLPLGQLTLIRAWHQAEPPFFWRGVIVGIAAQAMVALIALAAA
jgi:hypothetical protein